MHQTETNGRLRQILTRDIQRRLKFFSALQIQRIIGSRGKCVAATTSAGTGIGGQRTGGEDADDESAHAFGGSALKNQTVVLSAEIFRHRLAGARIKQVK